MNLKVKVLMLQKKISQTDIANNLSIKPSTVSGIVNGHRKSLRIQKAIAEALGMPYEKLWGKSAWLSES